MTGMLVPKAPDDAAAQRKDRRARAATAGLSAVGAGAGALGLGVGAKEVLTHGWKGTPRLTRSLIPVELAGLAGEVSATHLLHQDVKNKQPVAKGSGMEISSGGQRGKRIREDDQPSKVERMHDEEVGKAVLAGIPKVVGPAVKKPETIAQMGARMRRDLGFHLSGALKEKGTVVQPVGKAVTKPKPKDKPKGKLGEVANLGVDGTFMGQQAASHLERAKIHRDRGNQLHMEAIEEESALKRRQALAHLRQAALLEHSAKQRTIGAVGALGLKDGMGSAGMKGTGEGDKVHKAADRRAEGALALAGAAGAAGGAGYMGRRAGRDFLAAGRNEHKAATLRQAAGHTSVVANPARMGEQAAKRSALASQLVSRSGARGAAALGLAGGAATLGAVGIHHLRNPKGVAKARRFDPEADRQRRLGVYSGLAGGGALLTGEATRHTLQIGPHGRTGPARGGAELAHHIGFKPGATKRGLLLGGATLGLGGLAAASYKRGISRRNQTWT